MYLAAIQISITDTTPLDDKYNKYDNDSLLQKV